ncbi:hypothetical protein L915_04435 [Phytophthora nicotianae]|uniref:BZIP domain-containing protein n=1 Tax=Phytophthora nicotianae TaxID=4792 RepID=W2JGM0_PHYNI|nr:hypothetical protein L915_04435 [Phytophthora nicotianae]ETL45534.1 hypothetical protein L916_04405 [Phytophthora nicotianae]
MDIDILETPLHSAPLWTEDEVAFVSALLSDAPDVLSDEQSSPNASSTENDKVENDAENDAENAATNEKTAKKSRKSVKKKFLPEERAAARRASHRETMRRSRQRFRDQIAAMVRTVQELETVKAQALVQQQLSETGLQGHVALLEKQKQQLLDENDALHAQLVDSLLAITRAHPGNFEHDKVQRRVAGQVDSDKDAGENFYVMNTGSGAVVKRDPVTLCDFVTWDIGTIGHCLQLVQDATSEIARFYTAIANVKPDQPSGDMMGWRQQRRALVKDNTCVEFAFDKTFAGYSPGQLFHRTWAFFRNQRQFAMLLEPVLHALQLEVLHEINDDIVVVRRMQQELSPEGEKQTPTKYRTIYLLYRMASPAGLFVALQSVNPSFTRRCGCANNLWFESFMWMGFSAAATGESGCRVRFGGTIDGHSEEFARRWQREIFFMLMRWESHNVAPVVLLPQSDATW